MGQEAEARGQVLGPGESGDRGPGAFVLEGRLQVADPESARVSGGAEARGAGGSHPGRGACMCVVRQRHLNIVGMEDKFKTHQAQLRQNDNVRNMNHSF